jgi:hypothetical protein
MTYIAAYIALTAYFIHRCWVPSAWDVLCSAVTSGALVLAIFFISTAFQMVTQ